MILKDVGKKVAKLVGIDYHRAGKGSQICHAEEQSQGWNIDRVRTYGPEIRTCVDVGSAGGTVELYEAFPDAFHVMIEPLEEYRNEIQQVLSQVQGKHFATALGSSPGTSQMTVEGDYLVRSSLLQRTELTRRKMSDNLPTEQREVPIITLDQLADSEQFVAPFGLKIDTEGFELEVIRGSQKFLQQTAFVIAEVSYAKRFESGYEFTEFTEQMAKSGFYLYDVLRVAGNNPIKYFDSVFKPIPR